jgi:hypothetical protein
MVNIFRLFISSPSSTPFLKAIGKSPGKPVGIAGPFAVLPRALPAGRIPYRRTAITLGEALIAAFAGWIFIFRRK